MMTFQIHALPKSLFSAFFTQSDEELLAQNIQRISVNTNTGFPCRVSLADAKIGETVLLLNYEHQPHKTPYQASHAVFVREAANQYHPAINEVPSALSTRLLSVRAFNHVHNMIDANVVKGTELADQIKTMFTNNEARYLHIHNAKPGCFAARVSRA